MNAIVVFAYFGGMDVLIDRCFTDPGLQMEHFHGLLWRHEHMYRVTFSLVSMDHQDPSTIT